MSLKGEEIGDYRVHFKGQLRPSTLLIIKQPLAALRIYEIVYDYRQREIVKGNKQLFLKPAKGI